MFADTERLLKRWDYVAERFAVARRECRHSDGTVSFTNPLDLSTDRARHSSRRVPHTNHEASNPESTLAAYFTRLSTAG